MVEAVTLAVVYIALSYVYMFTEGIIIEVFGHQCGIGCECRTYYASLMIAPLTAPVVIGERLCRLIKK